ncbi:MAG: CRISPR-associated protein Cas5 [Saprospiraceae bacterium]
MRQKLISFDLKGDFGVFKKPDVNEGLQLTFNILHKPALLGILGAIAGLEGYQRRGYFPEYFEKLRGLRVGIEPLEGWHDKGNFVKTVVKYTNTVGYANADGNLIVTEQTLRSPAYRVYLLLDLDDALQNLLHTRIRAAEAEFLPYFGKNECAAWWEADGVREYGFEPFVATADFRVRSVFVREGSVQSQRVRKPRVSFALRQVDNTPTFAYFERLPIDFFVGDPPQEAAAPDLFSTAQPAASRSAKPMKFVQYDLAEFAFTNWTLRQDSVLDDLFLLRSANGGQSQIIQLF